jgi:RNA polymerase sigma-70 factor (ECF subfamily)
LATEQEISDFLRSVDKRAFKRTVFAVRDDAAALDIVQDAMMRLAEKYADRPAAELPLLFQRILSNATMDWFRREKARSAVMQNFSSLVRQDEDGEVDLMEVLQALEGDGASEGADAMAQRGQTLDLIEQALGELPARQREAFLLRYWEEFDVSETASVMGCSEGSVKTHCSRAIVALARILRSKGLSS